MGGDYAESYNDAYSEHTEYAEPAYNDSYEPEYAEPEYNDYEPAYHSDDYEPEY